MAQSDEELLDAWRSGDGDAGATLFRRFFVNKVPERDVDDLLQRTFTALVEGRDGFRGEARVRTFMFAIARRVLLRYLRDFARRDSKQAVDLGVSSIAQLGVTPGTAISTLRDHEMVRQALQTIPVHFQTILELSYWEELDTAELAEIFEIEPATVRTRLFRARKALAKALEGQGLGSDESVDRVVRDLSRTV